MFGALGFEVRSLPNGPRFRLKGNYSETAAYDILLLPLFHHSNEAIEATGKMILMTLVGLLTEKHIKILQRPSRLLG
ncbi:hypothetical protein GPECTOR_207g394 [Gonium pectorale]|uniref:Uncharacterized protein n=1 Tax=Gonium pectorale TaxID=33097 RepID=A0A150FWV5_GONPE|nr:hypothetical protein GPECTOR_207g394 [Gonium pectorale]|eukprot:KXZ42093.1 hypothetical protein GPECTOR_207g394 [Gonium pectorale]